MLSVSVRDHVIFWQSLRSMRRTEAQRRKARPVRFRHSQSLARRRQRFSHDRAGTRPMLPRLAALGFQGDLLGDSGLKGAPFVAAALVHDIHVSVSPGGTREGRFLPSGIRWVVERLFAWLSRYRRLNIVFDRLVAQTQAQQGV